MAIRLSSRVAASYNRTLTLPFRSVTTSNWMQFYVGAKPDNATIEGLANITPLAAAHTGALNSNAGSSFGYSANAANPLFYMVTAPTVKTFAATQVGTIEYAAVTGDGWFILVSVSALNGGGVIQVDNPVIAEVGQIVTLQAAQFKAWRV